MTSRTAWIPGVFAAAGVMLAGFTLADALGRALLHAQGLGGTSPISGVPVAILLGLFSRWAALALAGFCIVTALVFHTGWSGDGGQGQLINFMKNLALAGGLLLLAANGPGKYAVTD